MSKQLKEVRSIMLLILLALCMGFTVGIIDKLLGLPHWWTLPGGSVGCGYMTGMMYPNKRLPFWYRILVGIGASFLGWFLSLFVAQAFL